MQNSYFYRSILILIKVFLWLADRKVNIILKITGDDESVI